MLKIYIYGYLNQVQSSRRLEREAQRNVELMWLTRETGTGLQDDSGLFQGQRGGDPVGVPGVCDAVPQAGSVCGRVRGDRRHRFKAVNNRDRNWTKAS